MKDKSHIKKNLKKKKIYKKKKKIINYKNKI